MYLLFDIGGTTTRFSQTNSLKSIGGEEVFSTPKTYKGLLDLFSGLKIKKAAGCVAGAVSTDGRLVSSGNLQQFTGKPVGRDLSRILGTKVALMNDAVMAGVGECIQGAGVGSKICAYVTIGTGIGGARIIDGKADEFSFSFEPGKQLFQLESGSKSQTFEKLISGKNLFAKYGKIATDIAEESVWRDVEKVFSLGLANIIHLWTPDTVVLGGSVILKTKFSIPNLQTQLKAHVKPYRFPKLKKAKLEDFSGLYGALHYLKAK